ncbi:MAG TPA: hypothetical protein VFK02_29695 [Kofleriaceae bacterium]|nr:hypothetical protein [Kofleriaceae bacterium]
MPVHKMRHGRKEYGVEDEAGNWLIEPSATTKGATRVAAKRLAERRGESVYVIEVGEDRDGGSRIVVDREEIRPHAEPPRSRAQIKRDIDEVLGDTATLRQSRITRPNTAGVTRFWDLYESELRKAVQSKPVDYPLHQGESPDDFARRTRKVLQAVAEEHSLEEIFLNTEAFRRVGRQLGIRKFSAKALRDAYASMGGKATLYPAAVARARGA